MRLIDRDMSGMKFSLWTVLSFSGVNRHGRNTWFCMCSCGTVSEVAGTSLRLGKSKSCGHQMTIHGMRKSSEYTAYRCAKSRCTRPTDQAWVNYGGRGIEFKFVSFVDFFRAIGKKPSPKHCLDRIDVNGHYEDGNVRWTSIQISAVNTRTRKDNTSGFRGVYLNKKLGKWVASVGGKYLGVFESPQLAAQEYDREAVAKYGVEARRNFA